MDEELIKRRSAHERLMRPKGFNWHRLRLVDELNPRARKQLIEARTRIVFPTLPEWLLALAVAAAIVAAYFWRADLQSLWEWSTGR